MGKMAQKHDLLGFHLVCSRSRYRVVDYAQRTQRREGAKGWISVRVEIGRRMERGKAL